MGIEEGTFWDEHWVLYGTQFDNKFHILKKIYIYMVFVTTDRMICVVCMSLEKSL